MPRFTDADDASWGFTPGERARTRAAVEELRRLRAQRAALDAREAEVLAEVTGIAVDQISRSGSASEQDFPFRSMAAEIALALRESPRAMQGRMDRAFTLVGWFPATHTALKAGKVTAAHVRAIADAGGRISDDTVRAAYEAEIIGIASSTTPGRTKPAALLVADKHEPVSIAARHEAARAERKVWVSDLPDGLAELGMTGPAYVVHAVFDRLTSMGKAVTRDNRAVARELDGAGIPADDPRICALDDDRHLGQLRSDIALDLLLSGVPSGHDPATRITATVEVTIPVTTLTGLDDGPALLAGYGPIDPDTARRLAGNTAGWERLFVSPDTNALLTVDHYTPTAAQRRFLLARDQTCRVPGCSTKAKHADIDHTIPYARGGPTAVGNTGCLCEPHHMMKHHSPWRLIQLPGARFRWTSPCGYEYIDTPPILYTGDRADRETAPF